METRGKTEYKLYILELAEMHGGVDKASVVAIFTEYQKLKDYYNSQLAEKPYKDKGINMNDNSGNYVYQKVFKKGSPLEWYNPANNLEIKSYQECSFGGVRVEWFEEYPTRESIRNDILFNPI
jgi:hypothetical protein